LDLGFASPWLSPSFQFFYHGGGLSECGRSRFPTRRRKDSRRTEGVVDDPLTCRRPRAHPVGRRQLVLAVGLQDEAAVLPCRKPQPPITKSMVAPHSTTHSHPVPGIFSQIGAPRPWVWGARDEPAIIESADRALTCRSMSSFAYRAIRVRDVRLAWSV